MYERGADLKIISAEEAGQPPQRKEDLPKDSDRQKEEFWDAAEYAADCHLGGALSENQAGLSHMFAPKDRDVIWLFLYNVYAFTFLYKG